MAISQAAVSLLAAIAVSLLLLPLGFRTLCRLIGRNLQSRTSSRRSLLVARANSEEKTASTDKTASSPSNLDAEWEKIESHTPSSGEKSDVQSWNGTIGFFHPFWYRLSLPLWRCSTNHLVVMRAAAVSACYGLPSEQPKNGTQKHSVSSIQATTMSTKQPCFLPLPIASTFTSTRPESPSSTSVPDNTY